jgi:hypothetical protein
VRRPHSPAPNCCGLSGCAPHCRLAAKQGSMSLSTWPAALHQCSPPPALLTSAARRSRPSPVCSLPPPPHLPLPPPATHMHTLLAWAPALLRVLLLAQLAPAPLRRPPRLHAGAHRPPTGRGVRGIRRSWLRTRLGSRTSPCSAPRRSAAQRACATSSTQSARAPSPSSPSSQLYPSRELTPRAPRSLRC